MAEQSFSSGLQGAMSLFQTLASVSNYNALIQDRQEAREIQRQELERRKIEDERQTQLAEFTMAGLLVDPSKGVPLGTAIEKTNQMVTRRGGSPVSAEQYERFQSQLDTALANPEFATGEARRAVLQDFTQRADEHPIYLRALAERRAQLEDWVGAPGAGAIAESVGLREESVAKLLPNLRPGEVLSLLKDNDFRKVALFNQANKTVSAVLSGEEVPEGVLANDLAAAHGAGFKIGPDAADIIKGAHGETLYNVVQKDVASFNDTAVRPFAQLMAKLPNPELLVRRLGRNRSLSLATLTEGTEDAIKFALKDPQKQQQFSEALAKMEAVYQQAGKSFRDFESRYKLAKNAPSTTPAMITLLDQQYQIEKAKAVALQQPFNAYQAFVKDGSTEHLTQLSKLGDILDETNRRFEKDKQKTLELSEKHTQEQIATGRTTRLTTQATNEFSGKFFELLGEHPEVFDQDGLMNASKAGKLAAPLIADIQNRTGVKLDVDSVVSKFASAAKRSVPQATSLEKLTPEQSVRFTQFTTGLDNLSAFKQLYKRADGSWDRKALLTAELRIPFSDGRTTDAIVMEMGEGKIRLESGAAVPDTEIVRLARRAMPLSTDSTSTINAKLAMLENFYRTPLEVMDPEGKLRSRLTPQSERIRGVVEAARGGKEPTQTVQPAPRTFDRSLYERLKKANPKASGAEIADMMHRELDAADKKRK